MPSCCVSNCSNTNMKLNRVNYDISFHLFPKDPYLKNRWILATGRKNWFPTKSSSICSAHFHLTDFNVTKKSRRLSELAFPTVDVWRTIEDEESSDEASNKHLEKADNNSSESAPSSPDSQAQLSFVQASVVKRLQKQRNRLLAALKLEKMKVKKFREQNRRKDKKIAALHNIIFEMKKKMFNREVDIQELKIEEVIVDNDISKLNYK